MGVLTAFIGPVCLFLGLFFSLYIKEKSTTIAEQKAAEAVKLALEIFKNELTSRLDLMYQRIPELKLMLETRDTKIEVIEDRQDVQAQAIVDLESNQVESSKRINQIEHILERLKDYGSVS